MHSVECEAVRTGVFSFGSNCHSLPLPFLLVCGRVGV